MNQSYEFRPTAYGSMRQPDLFSDRDIAFRREEDTPNQFFSRQVAQNVYEWTLVLNDLSGGLGRTRGSIESLINRTLGQTDGAPLDTRYVDSLHLPMLRRHFASPGLTSSTPTDPSLRATTDNTGSGTTVTGNRPTGTSTGDVLIAWVIHDDASTEIDGVPSGWSEREESSPGASGDFVVTMYEGVYDVTVSASASWDWSLDSSERWRVIIAAVENGAEAGASDSESTYSGTSQRFYMPDSGSPPVTPDVSSGWVNQEHPSDSPVLSSSFKQDTPLNTRSIFNTRSHNHNVLFRQYVVTPALAAQTISSQTVKIQAKADESTDSANMHLTWAVKVVSSDGNTVRGTVVSITRDGLEVEANQPGGKNRGDSATSTEVITQAGDYLVFEIGLGGNPSIISHGSLIEFGDGATLDLPENNTSTADRNPWIEFSSPITFEGQGEGDITTNVTRAGSLVLSLAAVDDACSTFSADTDVGCLTEEIDTDSNGFTAALYSESVDSVTAVTHSIDHCGSDTDIATQMVVIPPDSFGKRISHINLFGRHAIAVGDSDLIRESSDQTPELQTIGYTPGSVVNGLAPVIIGASGAEQRVAVMRSDAAIELLNDLSSNPSSAGTMHSDTNPAWGLIQTSLLTGDIQIYANGALRILSRTSAIGDQPTVTLDNLPNGGAAIGELWIPGAPIRTYWLIPLQDTGAEQAEQQNIPMKVVSMNLNGEDPQDLDVPLWAGSGGVTGSLTTAAPWQQGLLVTDGFRIVFHNGRNNILNWPGERSGVGVEGQVVCKGFFVRAHQLVLLAERVALQGGDGNTLYWLEEYDERTGAFHQISEVVDTGGVGNLVGVNAAGSLPVSRYSNVMYWHDDEEWSQQLLSDLLRNPSHDFNGITSAGQQFSFEASGTWTSPEWILRGFGKVPSVISEIQLIGNPEDGGTGGTVEVEVANQNKASLTFDNGVGATFRERDRWEAHHRAFPSNTSALDRLQVRVTASRGSDAARTPQCVPLIIRGLAFTDGKVRSPGSVLGQEWASRFM